MNKITRKRNYAAGTLLLIALALSIFAVLLVIMQNQSIEKFSRHIDNNNAKVKQLTSQVRILQKGNPGSLNTCIEAATNAYTTYIKKNGETVVDGNGKTTYRLDSSQWKEADDTLEAAKKACEAKFGPME